MRAFVTLAAAFAVSVLAATASLAQTVPSQTTPAPAAITDEVAFTTALNVLVSKGYEGITDLRREGDTVYATVSVRGQRTPVSVDLRTSTVELPQR